MKILTRYWSKFNYIKKIECHLERPIIIEHVELEMLDNVIKKEKN